LTEDGRLGPAERRDRGRARAWILQVHYRWESEGGEGTLLAALEDTLDTRRIARRRLPYIREVLGQMDEHLPEIDRQLRAALANWRLDRLSAMDRAVLRIGATEILFVDEVPPKVAIQEAIRLAEAYGGDESPGFVNGVLDALYKRATAKA
jgi:N utilization substance protein B